MAIDKTIVWQLLTYGHISHLNIKVPYFGLSGTPSSSSSSSHSFDITMKAGKTYKREKGNKIEIKI